MIRDRLYDITQRHVVAAQNIPLSNFTLVMGQYVALGHIVDMNRNDPPSIADHEPST